MSKQIYNKTSFLVRLDIGWWKILSRIKTRSGRSFKDIVEYALSEVFTGWETEDELARIFKRSED